MLLCGAHRVNGSGSANVCRGCPDWFPKGCDHIGMFTRSRIARHRRFRVEDHDVWAGLRHLPSAGGGANGSALLVADSPCNM